ncbi:Leucine carboxyl methyltransferase 2 [Mactra antiquata]
MSCDTETDNKMEKDKKSKTTKSRRETAVQGTNDSSIVSKCSMAVQGYFDDPYLQAFVSKVTRRAPLIHRGYYIRAQTIDYILKKFLSDDSSKKQVISLGAGFDSAYFRLKSKSLLETTVFFEVDFPEVVKRKKALIESNSELLSMVGENCLNPAMKSPLIELSTKTYKLIGADLSLINTLEAALKLCDIDFDLPTLLLSECVLTYMTRRTASNVIRWSGESFSNSVFVLYEQINPNDAFGLFMQNHFNSVGSPLKSINYFPTIQSQKDRFTKLGWSRVEAMDMNEFYSTLLTQEEHDRIERLEPFDEHEEWNLKCAHYMVLLGYQGSCDVLLKSLVSKSDVPSGRVSELSGKIKLSFTNPKQPFKRFGHCSTQLSPNLVFSAGGFGEQAGKHMRVTDILLVDLVTMETSLFNPNVDNKKIEVSRMHSTISCLKDGRILLIGGRMSPVRLCTQMVAMEMKSKSVNSNIVLESMNCGLNKCMNCGNNLNCNENDMNISNKLPMDTNKNCDHENSCNLENSVVNLCMNCSKLNIRPADSNVIKDENHVNSNDPSEIKDAQDKLEKLEEKVDEGLNGGEGHTRGQDDVSSIQCKDIQCSILEPSGDIPTPRWRHSSVLYNNNGVETIIMYGGRSQTVFALDDCYTYIPDTNCWQKVDTNGETPGACQSHTSCIWNNNMVISGGLNIDLQPLSNIYLLNLDTFTWNKIDCDINPRFAHSAHIIDDILILIGGVSFSHNPPGVAMVHLPSGICAEFALPTMDKTQLAMLHKHTSVVIDNDKILVLGGGGNCFSFGTHLNHSPIVIDISLAMEEMRLLCSKD